MRISITGHRPNKLGNDYDLISKLILNIKEKILETISCYYDKEYECYPEITLITGMALGIDTLFAQIAIEHKIPFIAALPCVGQDRMWQNKHQLMYWEIIQNNLCTIKYIGKHYTSDCMQKRNIWMVDNCDLLIAVWDGSSGGTANTIAYAKSIGREIVYIQIPCQ